MMTNAPRLPRRSLEPILGSRTRRRRSESSRASALASASSRSSGGIDLDGRAGRGGRRRRARPGAASRRCSSWSRACASRTRGTDRRRRRPRAPPSGSRAAPTCRSATCCCPGCARSTTPRWRSEPRALARGGPRARPRRCSTASASPASSAPAGGAVGRDAPARRLRAHAARGQAGAAARRALRLARRDHARPRCRSGWRDALARPSRAPSPGHPRRRGGALPLRPGAGALARARPRLAERRRRRAPRARRPRPTRSPRPSSPPLASARCGRSPEGSAMKRCARCRRRRRRALLGAWELAARWDVLADALEHRAVPVPAPSEIAESLWEDRELLAENAWVTLQEVRARLRDRRRARARVRRRAPPLRHRCAARSTRCWSPRRRSRSS